MQSDWRTSPSLNVISVVVSIIGLFLSTFTDISTPIKIVILIVGLAACLYAVIGGKTSSTISPGTVQKPADSISAPQPAPSVVNVESKQAPPAINAPQTPQQQPIPQPEGTSQTAPPPAVGTVSGRSPSSLKENLLGLLSLVIMFGIPGFFLLRSSVAWMHIVGIVLLIMLVLGGLGTVLPDVSDDSVKVPNKLQNILYIVLGGAILGIPGYFLFQSNGSWQHVVGIILLIVCVIGVPMAIYTEFFEKTDWPR